MAYRVIFWRPCSDVDVLQPPSLPLGEQICTVILEGQSSELLEQIPARDMLQRLHNRFPKSRYDENGYLHWSDDLDNGFVARPGPQFVEVVAFELSDTDLDQIFTVATEFACAHYDWGN